MSRRSFFVSALVCVLAFAFLGARGLWDPDEGRYTNVALMMLDSGDWLSPMRNGETAHFTKPPMTYWLIAASVAVFGHEAWAARVPVALAFVVCAWCVWGIARVLSPGREAKATLVFATMLAPFGAAHFVTTDFMLAAAEACAMYAYVRSRAHPAWLIACGAAFGVAFLIKGPPGLLPLLAILACASFPRRREPRQTYMSDRIGSLIPCSRRNDRRIGRWLAVFTFCAVALPWFIVVVLRHDGLLAHFLGAEVLDRVASNRFERHGEWYGWLVIYGPTLLLGALPWTLHGFRWVRTWRLDDPQQRLLIAWIVLPLIVFCIAQSRLPLYVLPLFVPIALGVASMPSFELPHRAWLVVWCITLLGLRFASTQIDSHRDASTWADAIRARTSEPVRRVVFVDDTARWGLHLHLGAQIERRSWVPIDEPRFLRKYDGELASAQWSGTVFVARADEWEQVRAHAAQRHLAPEVLGAPHAGRLFYVLRPVP